MDVREVQSSKALSPIVVTELGIVREAREEQYWKAFSPMDVTEVPIVTEVREVQSSKAIYSMVVTELGMVIEVREEHNWKACLPMDVTELGMVMEVREEQSKKAAFPIVVISLLNEIVPVPLEKVWVVMVASPNPKLFACNFSVALYVIVLAARRIVVLINTRHRNRILFIACCF